MLKPSFLSDEYLVSDDGNILSKKSKDKPLKPSKNSKGYLIVNLIINGKRIGVAVHTLVARAFCSGYKEGLTVNHKDGNKDNNQANNLEWITSYENTQHAIYVLGKNKFSSNNPKAKKVCIIDKITNQRIKTFDSYMDAAIFLEPQSSKRRLRIIEQSISRVICGLRKSYYGYIWQT